MMQLKGTRSFFIMSNHADKLADFSRLAERTGILCKKQPGSCHCFGLHTAREKAAGLLAVLTFGPWEQKWLASLCARRYEHFNAEERRQLLEKTAQFKQEDGFNWGLFAGPKRAQRLQAAYAEHLQNWPSLHLEGFARFRLIGYREYLQTLLSLAVDELLVEQEDSEYLLLLRDYMAARPLGGEIHVFLLRQGHYDICANSEGTLRFLEGGHLQGCEDMLIYALLSLAPQRLFLHLEQPLTPALANLLQELFKNRLRVKMSGGSCYLY